MSQILIPYLHVHSFHPAGTEHGFWQCHIDQGPIRKYDIPHTCLYGYSNISNVVSFQSVRFDACTSLLNGTSMPKTRKNLSFLNKYLIFMRKRRNI